MKKRLGACVVVFAILSASGLFAEEVQTESRAQVLMKEVVVTGTRFEEEIKRIPANITVIDEEDIRNSNAKSVPDLLRKEEGIVVRDWTGNRKQVEVDLRGFGESSPSNVLVLVDGRRVNQIDLSGVDWTQIPIENIERIEILRGTGSVLYGDNAVGGVINIITKIPSQEFSFSAGTRFGSYGLNANQFSVRGGQGKFRGSLYGVYESTDGYRENSEYRAKDVGGKLLFDATDSLSFNLSGSYHSDDFGLPGSLSIYELNTKRRSAATPLDEGSTGDGYLKGGVDLALGEHGDLVLDISYRKRQTDFEYIYYGSAFLQDVLIETWSITPRYVWNGAISGHKNTLIVGLDLYWVEQDAKSRFGSPASLTGLSNVEKNSYGLYVNNEFSILRNLILSLGGRYEAADYLLNQKDPVTGSDTVNADIKEREPAYIAGLTYLYSEKSSLFVRANRSFRFPFTDELIETDQATFAQATNQDLKPQTGRHYETGIRHFFTTGLEANLSLYRAEIKNEIFYNPTPKPFFGTNENHPGTLHQGIEFGFSADLMKHLTLYGNYTYEKATFEEEPFKGNNVPAVPRHKGNLGFRIHDMIPGLVFSADYNYVGSSFLISDQANQLEKLDDYYTIDARLSYSWKQLKAFAGVNNLTDKKYSQYGVAGGSGTFGVFYPSPERNWVAGVEFVF
ncbi:MAG: TonB-dependent receptor [Deltaproteobacteria bacterium]|nr:TonB-dependent receptor [Deltaproteobacteria bacterium]